MPIYYNNQQLSEICEGRNRTMVGFYNGNVVFDKIVNVNFVGTATGTNIWGTNDRIGGWNGTQSSSFSFNTPQKAGPFIFEFNWSGQAYVNAYYFSVTVTYVDNTTEVLYSGGLSGYSSGGSGTASYNFTMKKPWKAISAQHWRSILDTIYCYSYFGSVRMHSKGSWLVQYEEE